MSMPTNNFTFFAHLTIAKKPLIQSSCVKRLTVYEALAIACCDQLRRLTLRLEPRKLESLMRVYFHLFPNDLPQGLNIPVAQLLQLMETHSCEQLIPSLAHAFYQLTLHGLRENPTRYHEHALQKNDWMSRSAAHVISDLLGVTVRVKITASGKPLHASIVYPSESRLSLTLQVRHGQYSVDVNDVAYFRAYMLRRSAPMQFDTPSFPTLNVENEAVLQKFKETYIRLLTMVQAGELTKERLLHVFLGISPRLHGTQAYFDSIHWDHEGHEHDEHLLHELIRVDSVHWDQEGHDEHLIHTLIHNFSRLSALKDLNEDLLFNRIEAEVESEPELEREPTVTLSMARS